MAIQRNKTVKKYPWDCLLFIAIVKDHKMAGSHISVDKLFNVLTVAIVYPPKQ